MKVVWSPRALQDMDEGAARIWRSRPRAAIEWIDRVSRAAESLAETPFIGRVVQEFADEDFRELVSSRYRLVYRVMEDEVHIVAVVHPKRALTWDLVREAEVEYRVGRSGPLPREVPSRSGA